MQKDQRNETWGSQIIYVNMPEIYQDYEQSYSIIAKFGDFSIRVWELIWLFHTHSMSPRSSFLLRGCRDFQLPCKTLLQTAASHDWFINPLRADTVSKWSSSTKSMLRFYLSHWSRDGVKLWSLLGWSQYPAPNRNTQYCTYIAK